MCPTRGSALYGGQNFGMAGGTSDAGWPAANGHQVGGCRGLNDHRRGLGRLGHRWVEWRLGGASRLIGLGWNKSGLLAVRRRLLAVHDYGVTDSRK